MAKKRSRRARSTRKARRSASRIDGKLPKDAATLLVILRPRDGQEIFLEAELRALLGPTRREEGCLRYDLYRSAEGPAAFLMYEIWKSRAHHAAHTKTDHFLRWNARKDSLLTSRDAAFWKQIG